MTFKKNWEKADQHHQLDKSTIEEMVGYALPNQKLQSYEIISGGCANLNIKFSCVNNPIPLILRVYLRDKDAAFREQKLAALINQCVPIPEVYFVGDANGYRFALAEYKHGMTLRELLLNGKNENIQPIMVEAGLVLAKIQNYRFPISGFFDKDFNIIEPITQEGYITYAKECLEHPTTVNQVSKETISKIYKHLENYYLLFPDHTQNHLVHADFDPANILVQQLQGKWKISAVLDWEFAFSGSTLCDVANMLRYAHHMPSTFEDAFLQGLQKGGVQLPENWRITILLLDLLSLLDCLTRCLPNQSPNQCADICALLSYIVQQLDLTHPL